MLSIRVIPRRLIALLLVALCLPLSGCPKSGDTPNNTTGASSTASTIKAGLVTDVGGIGDKSFNALAWEGLQKAGSDLKIEIKYTESKQNADYVANLTRFAQNGYDVVFAVGFLMQDAMKEVATKYPKVKFAIIDGDAPNLPNCVSYKFREEEGSFLAGALAGAMTKTNMLGFVGGIDGVLIKRFEIGYKAGAMTTNPKITASSIKVGYAGKFDDPQKGQELALSQIGAGADIIYQAAGATGTGVIKAIQNKGAGYYAIGVDKDQDGDAPGRVLTSMIKRVDVAVYDVCAAVQKNQFKAGTVVLGLKEKGVGLSEMKYTKKDIPAPVLAKIDSLQQQIIAGTLKPPSTLTELQSFKVK